MKEDREKSLAIHEAAFPKESKKVDIPTDLVEEYTWQADYGDGKKWHTEKIITVLGSSLEEAVEEAVEESTSIFDNTLRPLPTNLYLDCKEYERGERWHKLGPEYVLAPNYFYLSAITYHFVFYALPFWLFIMLYW